MKELKFKVKRIRPHVWRVAAFYEIEPGHILCWGPAFKFN